MRDEELDEFAREISGQFINHLESVVQANPGLTTSEMGYVINFISRDMMATSIFTYGADQEFEFAERCMEALSADVLECLRKMKYGS